MLKVVYRPLAIAQLDSIANHTIEKWGSAQAKRYIADLRNGIEFAAEFPGIGSATHGLAEDYRKVRSGSHCVIYRYTKTELIVIRIIHEREDVPSDIEDFW